MARAALIVAGIALLAACSPVRRLLPQEKLLTGVRLEVDGKSTSDDVYWEVVQQLPNRNILGWKAYLALHNLPPRESEKAWARWLHRIGEAPVVLDPVRSAKTLRQLEHVAENDGYLRAQGTIAYADAKKPQRTAVVYEVKRGPQFRIGTCTFTFYSPALEEANAAHPLQSESLLQTGAPLRSIILDAERNRIATALRELGFFSMGPELVRIQIDTLKTPGIAHLEILLEDPYVTTPSGPAVTPHRVRTVGQITVYPNYRYTDGSAGGRPVQNPATGIRQVSTDGLHSFNTNRLNEWIEPRPKATFRASSFEQTVRRVSSFPAVQSAEWRFSEARGRHHQCRPVGGSRACGARIFPNGRHHHHRTLRTRRNRRTWPLQRLGRRRTMGTSLERRPFSAGRLRRPTSLVQHRRMGTGNLPALAPALRLAPGLETQKPRRSLHGSPAQPKPPTTPGICPANLWCPPAL